MIRQIVMWRVRGENAIERQAARELVRDAFEGLRGRIPGMTRLEVGLDASGVDCACDVVLVSDFVSSAALASCAVHPEHLRVRKELGDLRVERYRVDHVSDNGLQG